jgi:L-xylulokinase
VVFSHRTHLEGLRSGFALAGPARLCGGGARSPQWSPLLADAAGLDLGVTDTEEADAVTATVRVTRRHQARPSTVLDDRFRRYLDLVDTYADDTAGCGQRPSPPTPR